MMRVLTGGLACVLVLTASASAGLVDATVNFGGPGNTLTTSGTLLGSATISGSGGMYTWDDVNDVWIAETFTVAQQTISLQADPALTALTASPTGSMTVAIDDGTFAVDSFFDIAFDLAPGGMPFDMLPASLTADLDAGGTVSIDLDGAGLFSPLTWDGANVTAGVGADVMAMAGPIPLGYLFNASVTETVANAATLSALAIDPGVGAWYEFGASFSADFEEITLDISDTGSFSVNTYSSSQFPYYQLTLDYDVSGCASLCDIQADFAGVGAIPEPTTLALLLLAPAALRLRRR